MNNLDYTNYILIGKIPVPCHDAEQLLKFDRGLDSRRVKFTTVLDEWEREVEISTVFLGMNINFCFDGPPLFFETMVFASGSNEWSEIQRRYETWDQAIKGHNRTVRMVRKRCMGPGRWFKKVWRFLFPKDPK